MVDMVDMVDAIDAINTIEKVDRLIKENKLIECVSFLREHTKYFSLMKILCEKIVTNNTIEKSHNFWNDFAIVHYYLGDIEKSSECYNNIFQYNKCLLTENDINFYIHNMMFSILQCKFEHSILLDGAIKNITVETNKYIKPQYYSMNPSIIKTQNGYTMNVRTVNYMFSENFQYIKNHCLCNTINFMFQLNNNLEIIDAKELKYCSKTTLYNGDFNGWEDIRLFNYNNKLHCSFTCLQTNPERNSRICFSDISNESPCHVALDNYGKNNIQKNWTPVVTNATNATNATNDVLYFIYSFYPLTILKYDEKIQNVVVHQVSKPHQHNKWRGGTPAISLDILGYNNLFICVIHESQFPIYKHKFVLIQNNNDIFSVVGESVFFHFIDNTIEFCVGLTLSHDNKTFILTFGKMDRECYIFEQSVDKIIKLIQFYK